MAKVAECKCISPTRPNSQYISCIKIHGYRILPPLLDDEKRNEMQHYKKLAMEVEEKLRTMKIQNQSPDSTTDGDIYAADIDTSLSESVASSSDKSSSIEDTTYKSQISFSENRSDILNMLSESNKIIKSNQPNSLALPFLDSSAITKVPLSSNNGKDVEHNYCDLPMTEQASTDMNNENGAIETESDITPYLIVRQQSYTLENSDKVFSEELLKELVNVNGHSNNKSSESSSPNNSESYCSDREDTTIINKTQLSDVYTDNEINQNEQMSIESNTPNKSNQKDTPQSLVRSNSYILETPSPLLLAKMREESANDTDETNSSSQKRKSWDLIKAKEKWSSIQHELNSNLNKTEINSNKITSWPTFTSLPPSSVTSPEGKMFLSSVDNLSQIRPKKTIFKIYKRKTDTQINCQSITPERNRFQKRIIAKTPEMKQRIIKSFITPSRTAMEKEAEKELSPKQSYSEPKPKKAPELISENNKTDIVIRKPCTIIRQRSLFLDESSTGMIQATKQQSCNSFTKSQSCDTVTNFKKPVAITSINVQEHIRDVISKVQVEQSKQMSELIAKQKREQEFLMKTFTDQQVLLLSKLHDTYKTVLSPNLFKNIPKEVNPENNSVINGHKLLEYTNNSRMSDKELLKNSENLLLECKQLLRTNELEKDSLESGRTSSQTIFCQALSPDDLPDELNATVRTNVSDSFNRISSDNTNTFSSTPRSTVQYKIVTSTKYSQSFSEDSLENSTNTSPGCTGRGYVTQVEKNVVLYDQSKNVQNCSRQLFPTRKQVWAADKICAASRGYLVRRLLRTERVQYLIQTIKDTLICAMELHNETTDNIQPADVELHRRLLLQVTAACCNFHDIFFSLSKTEQMSVISMDRERQKEKSLRPVSARSSSSISSATQRSLERKMRKEGQDFVITSAKKSNRSCMSARDFRSRAKSVELTVSETTQSKRISPQSYVMRRTMSYGANRKPWR